MFPGVIYGATIGGLELQRYFIRSYQDPYIEEVEPVQYVEEERQDIVRENVAYILLDVRINRNVDEYIEPIVANKCKTQEIHSSAYRKYQIRWKGRFIQKTGFIEENI